MWIFFIYFRRQIGRQITFFPDRDPVRGLGSTPRFAPATGQCTPRTLPTKIAGDMGRLIALRGGGKSHTELRWVSRVQFRGRVAATTWRAHPPRPGSLGFAWGLLVPGGLLVGRIQARRLSHSYLTRTSLRNCATRL